MHFTSTDILTVSVVFDSLVTMTVGWRLGKRAHKETTRAAETIKPAIQEELANAITMILPAVIERVVDLIKPSNEVKSVSSGTVRSIPISRVHEQ